MRTTVDLPQSTYDRVKTLAAENRQSLSTTLAQLTMIGLNTQNPDDTEIQIDPRTGIATISTGRPITAAEVAAFLDEDE